MTSTRCQVTIAITLLYLIGECHVLAQETSGKLGPKLWFDLMGIMKDAQNVSSQLKSYIQKKQMNGHSGSDITCSPPCANDGICVAKDTCRCVNGWNGPTCTEFDCSDDCLHGRCTGPDTCYCDSGWTGITCSKPICNPSCLNKGVCAQPDECRCSEGYSGQRCQDAICNPPCEHGSCYKPNQCVCDPGWQGHHCATPRCSPVCQNDGECISPNTCRCTDEWRGYSCNIPICKNRCQNGGACISPDVCQCPAKYEGKFCQIALDRKAQAGRTCTVWNSYHFRTFDGYTFDFPGLCRYDLSKDTRDGLFSIELIKDKKLLRSAAVRGMNLNGFADAINGDDDHHYTGKFMAIVLSIRGMSPSITLLPNRHFLFGDQRITQSRYAHDGISVETIGRYLRVKTRYGISILWDGEGVADIALEDDQYQGSLGGLCGNFDSDPRNDMVMRDASPVEDILDFAYAWRIRKPDENCVDVTTISSQCGNQTSEQMKENNVVCDVLLLKHPAFQSCRDREIGAESFASACKADMCTCEAENRVECTCQALTQYSRLCSHETGMSPKWRKASLCGVECPAGKVYEECGSSCPRTCESLVTPEADCDERCVDGCTCTNGTVLRHDNVCVAEEDCPCMHGDVPYPSGHVFLQNCMECKCMGALWNCRNLQCPGECSAVGDSHYTTFDGLLSKLYGECQFTFVKDCSDNDLFSVIVDNSLCANDLTETCVTEVIVIVSPITSSAGSARTTLSTNGHSDIKITLGRNGRVSVDDQRIVLPQIHEHYQIFQASSEFIQLRLTLGITIEWNGKSRLYVKADQPWKNKVCGVCGNFNDNKRDDMMNFNGLIEKSATTFSNLMKFNSGCRDATRDQSLDPCVSNSKKAQYAEERCGLLKSVVFKKCHPFVNPEEALIMCRHDVCQCDKDAACYCNAVSHYARLCARKGQIIDWRTDEICPVVCTGGKTYQQCGTSCISTCRSISDPQARCSESCIEGCNCPPDTFLNEYDICVPRSSCQCYSNGNVYQPLHIHRRQFSVCHCRNGQYSCHTTSDYVSNSSVPLPINGTQCPTGWEFYGCEESFDGVDEIPRGIECQKTCNRLNEKCVAYMCTSGCGCPSNFVLDIDRNTCVEKSQCPCYYRGRAYYPGDVTKVDCNTCTCRNREWECTDNKCPGTCIAYGDPHFKTFDGYKFNFMGQCGYILTQDYCGNHGGQFRVYVENSNCGSNGVSCTKSVTITFTGNVYVKLNKDNFGYTKNKLVTWGVLHGSSTNHTTVLWDYHNAGIYTIVTTNIGLTVVWDKKTTVYVELDPKYQGRVCGLCGNFDTNMNDDMMMSDRMPAINPTEFANSWKVAASCQDAVERESECSRHPQRNIWAQRNCKILYDPMFAVCHSVVDVVWYHSNCIFDACSCDNGGDCECLCTAIAAYALACAEQGIKIRWRTDKVCPLMCEAYEAVAGECTWHYNECGSVCPETCQHRFSQDSFTCSVSMPCVEGCFPVCPSGTVYDENTKKCVTECGETCRANGQFYGFGEVVSTTDCSICECKSPGAILCSTLPKCISPNTTAQPGLFTTTKRLQTTGGVTSQPGVYTTAYPNIFSVLTNQFTKRYCSGEVHLGYVIDGSHRVSSSEFETIKWIIEQLTDSIMPSDYGRNDSHFKVAISQIGNETEKAMEFNSKQDVVVLDKSIRDLELHNARGDRLGTELRNLLQDYQMAISKQETNMSYEIHRVLFLVTYSPADDEMVAVLHSFQEIDVKVIILSGGNGPSDEELKELLGESSTAYHVDSMDDFTSDEVKALEVLEAICEGENERVPRPTAPSPTTLTPLPTTTSITKPDEMCTMQADLVVIIDLQLLKNSDTENTNFLQLLNSVLSEIIVRSDKTHVTILLSDSRTWRVSRFVSSREELSRAIQSDITQKLESIINMQHFDIRFALATAVDSYLLSERSGARVSDISTHKSILVFHDRQAYLPTASDSSLLNNVLQKLSSNGTVFTVVTQKGIFNSNISSKIDWISTVSTDNLVFADISHEPTSRTALKNIMRKVCRTPPQLPIPKIYCDGKMDIIFLWDRSSSTSINDLKNMIAATKKIVGSLDTDVSEDDEYAPVKISIAEFGNTTNFLIEANQSALVDSFLTHEIFSSLNTDVGSSSKLGNAILEAAKKFGESEINRNKTLIIFSSQPAFDEVSNSTKELDAIDAKRVIIGFGQDMEIEQLESIAGDGGLFRKTASSREILDNDLGLKIMEKVCTPTVRHVLTTPAPKPIIPLTTTVSPVSTISSTGEVPLAVCSMTADLVVIYDSSLGSKTDSVNSTFSVLKGILQDMNIGSGEHSSRVSIIVVDENPTVLVGIEEGSNKEVLLEKLDRLQNINQSFPVSLPIVKSIRMANEFVFGMQPRRDSDILVQKEILLITDRLPGNELDLFRENSLESVKSTIDDMSEQDVNVYIIYKDNTFHDFSTQEKQDWLSALEPNSFFLEESDDAATFGSEVLDVMCASTKLNATAPTSTIKFTEEYTKSTTIPPYCMMDVEIIVDSSYSIGPEFSKIKEFLQRLVDDLEIVGDVVRVGVVQYSMDTVSEFHLGDFIGNRTMMKESISRMTLRQGRTYTYSAIDYVLENELSEAAGRRTNVPLAILLLTDGRIKDVHRKDDVIRKLDELRVSLHDNGIFLNVMAIGFGSANPDELNELADSGSYVEEASGFTSEFFSKNTTEQICTFKERPRVKPTVPVTTTQAPVCSNMPATDVLFILDGSVDITGQGRKEIYQEFLQKMIEMFKIGSNDTQVGVSLYSDGIFNTHPNGFGISQFINENELRSAVSTMELTAEMQENVADSLKELLSNGFSTRPGVRKVGVVFLEFPPFSYNDIDASDVFRQATSNGTESVVLLASDNERLNIEINNVVGPAVDDFRKISVPGGIKNLKTITEMLKKIICGDISPTPTAEPISTAPRIPVSTIASPTTIITSECDIRTDILIILDNSILNEENDIDQFVANIERRIVIGQRHAQIGIIGAHDLELWKPIAEFRSTASDVIRDKQNSQTTTSVVDIGLTMDNVIEAFETAGSDDAVKRSVILILQSEVQGSISSNQWKKLEQLDVSMVAIAVDSKFLQSSSTKWIRLLHIPMTTSKHLSRTTDAVVSELCSQPLAGTAIPFTTASLPQLVCPPGDVVIMYDAMLLSPHAQQKMKDYLKKLVNLLSHTYSRIKTRFALVSFGNEPILHFELSDTRSPMQVNRMIQNSRHVGSTQQLNAGKALNFVRQEVASPVLRGFRNNTLTIMMLLSRSSHDDVQSVIRDIDHSADVITLAIGYTEQHLDQLTTVEFGGVPVSSVNRLGNLEYETLELICSVLPVQTTSPTTTLPVVTKPKQPCKIDIVFMVDEDLLKSSGTVTSVKRYLTRISNHVILGEDFFKIKVKKFSSTSQDITSGFIDSVDQFQSQMEEAIVTSPVTGPLNVQFGLENAISELDENGRQEEDVGTVIVLLLKRRDRQNLDVDLLSTLNDRGVTVFTVLVNDAMFMNLRPLRRHLSNYRYIRAYLPRYLENFAPKLIYYLWNAVCAKRPSHTLPYVETPMPQPKSMVKCSRVMDITYIIDDELLVDNYERGNLQHFLKDTIREFEVGPHKARISLLQYNAIPNLIFNLDSVFYIKAVFQAIEDNMRLPKYYKAGNNESFVSNALEYVTHHILRTDGSRNCAKYIILISKSPFNDENIDLLNAGVHLYDNNITLILLSPQIDDDKVRMLQPDVKLSFANSDELSHLLHNVTEILCQEPPLKSLDKPTLPTKLSTEVITTKQPEDCSNLKLDLLVLLQATTYFSETGLDDIKSFVLYLAKNFNLTENGVQMSVMQFNNMLLPNVDRHSGFDINGIDDTTQLPRIIFDLELAKGSNSNPGLALKTAMNNYFTAEHGAREGIRKAIVILMSGNITKSSVDELNEAAREAIERGHSVFIIAIPEKLKGTETQNMLTQLAQIPSTNKLFARNDFKDLLNRTLIAEYAEKICQDLPYLIPITTRAQYTPTKEPFTATTRKDMSSQVTTSIAPGKCEYDLSIVFLLDVSNLADTKRHQMVEFVLHVVEGTNLGPERSNVAVIAFSSTAEQLLDFSTGSSYFGVSSSLLRLRSFGKITNTGAALHAAAQAYQTARSNTNWVTVLVTDGRAKDDLQTGLSDFAAIRRDHGNVKIVAIGLESASEEQLSSLADENSVILIDTYNNLLTPSVVETAKTMVCTPPPILPIAQQPTTSRVVTVTSSFVSSTTCHCYWTEYESKNTPTDRSPGDDESWARSATNSCKLDYSMVNIQCRGSGGFIQPNMKCNMEQSSLACHNFEVVDGGECFDYSVSFQCCSSSCGEVMRRVEETPLYRCNKRMDVVFVLDETLQTNWLDNAKSLIGKLGDDMHIGQNYTRSAIVPYGSVDEPEPVDWTDDVTRLKQSLDVVKSVSLGSSDVATALSTVRRLALLERDDADQSTVEKTIVVFLSDSSTGIVDMLVKLLEEQKFQFIIIGLGKPKTSLVRRFETKPNMIFSPSTKSQLMNESLPDILQILCELPPTPEPSSAPTPSAASVLLTTMEEGTGTGTGTPATKQTAPTTVGLTNVSATTQGPLIEEYTTQGTTTLPVIGCEYHDEETGETMIVELGGEIHPRSKDPCFSLRCVSSGNLEFDDKRLICEKLSKPECENKLDPILRIDDSCNCQWECPCYCQMTSTIYHTFDGLSYPADGDCDQVVTQGTSRATRNHGKFVVRSKKEKCGEKTCIGHIHLNWRQDEYDFDRFLGATINGTAFNPNNFKGSIETSLVGEIKFIIKIKEIGLRMEYTPKTNALTLSLPADIWSDDTEGLCGTCNHYEEDEMQLRNGELTDDVQEFIEDWTEGETCTFPEPQPCSDASPTRCEVIKDLPDFEDCRANIDWERYYSSCKIEVCQHPEGLCDSLSNFADACRHQGYCVEWRSEDLCPINCTRERVYKACVPSPYEKSCKNETKVATSDVNEDQEGCFLDCQDNEVVVNDTCVNEEHCSHCFDNESGDFKEAGEIWVPQIDSCSFCSCDATSLEINCQPVKCWTTPTTPTCGECEKVVLKATSSHCCPEYECVCDYENCNATTADECNDGMILSFNTKNGSCQPVAECKCDLNRCTEKEGTCESPMLAKEEPTTCCPKYTCSCPECQQYDIGCAMGYIKNVRTDICNCSISTCESMPACVINDGNQTLIKTEGEKWTDQFNPCISCQCDREETENAILYNSTCSDDSISCTPCSQGFKEEHSMSDCCPKCVPAACIIEEDNGTSTVHQIGEEWEDSVCQNLTCTMKSGHPVTVSKTEPCDKVIADCEFGYKLQCDNNPCCPKCVCVPDEVCVYNGSVIQRPGQNWTIDECTSCECKYTEGLDGFHDHVCTTVQCQTCKEGFKIRDIEGSCCGECIPVVCKITVSEIENKTLLIGEELHSSCVVNKCVEGNNGAAVLAKLNISCPELDRDSCYQQGGEVTIDENGCCLICNFEKRECQPRNGTLLRISMGNCTSDEEILIPHCQGQCSSSAHYGGLSKDFNHYCSCCKPTVFENRTAQATCLDGSKIQIPYKYVQNCSCDKVVCTEWKKQSYSGEIIGYDTQPSVDGLQDATSSVLSLWASDRTIHVVEIRDVDQRLEFDLKSLILEVVKELNMSNYEIRVVQTSARESNLRKSMKQSFLRSITEPSEQPALPS